MRGSVWLMVGMAGAAAPEASATGGLGLAAVGTCPGTVEFRATGGTPNEPFAAARAQAPGGVVLGTGPCVGTQLGLNPSVVLLAQRRFDATGQFVAVATLGPASCGRAYQVVDLTTCETSDVVIR